MPISETRPRPINKLFTIPEIEGSYVVIVQVPVKFTQRDIDKGWPALRDSLVDNTGHCARMILEMALGEGGLPVSIP